MGKIYWFCRHCHQEIPYGVLDNIALGYFQSDQDDGKDKNLVVAGAASENRDFQSLEKSLQQVAIAVKKVQDYQCLHSIDRKLQELAALDELTQLANRHYFEEYLKQQWRRMEREQESISLIICDIDSFGNFNRIL
jgi:PleD family two-component response regulator